MKFKLKYSKSELLKAKNLGIFAGTYALSFLLLWSSRQSMAIQTLAEGVGQTAFSWQGISVVSLIVAIILTIIVLGVHKK